MTDLTILGVGGWDSYRVYTRRARERCPPVQCGLHP